MYLVEINSQMIGIVFNINFSTLFLNQTEQWTCLECFQTLSIEKRVLVYSFSIATQIDSTHIADCFPDIIIFMVVWKYLFFTIYLYIYIYIYIYIYEYRTFHTKDFSHKSFSTSFGPFAQFLVVISHNNYKWETSI